jgi:hypothetical protein
MPYSPKHKNRDCCDAQCLTYHDFPHARAVANRIVRAADRQSYNATALNPLIVWPMQ